MSFHRTPPPEWDALGEAERLANQVMERLVVTQPETLEESVQRLLRAAAEARQLALAVQTAAGRLQCQLEAGFRAAGQEQCVRCKRWRPREELVVQDTGGGPKAAKNHWYECEQCEPSEKGTP